MAKETANTIAGCQLPIAALFEPAVTSIGNRQSAIGNVLVSENW